MENTYKFWSPSDSYGPAIEFTHIDKDGKMWVGNGEYETQVNFCPMTGKPAPTQMEVVKVWENKTEEYQVK